MRGPTGTRGAGVQGAAIVGAGGFLGAHLVRGFEARGVRTVPIVREVQPRSPAEARTLDEVAADPTLLSDVDVLVHVAAAGRRPHHDVAAERAAHLELVDRVVGLAGSAGVRRVVLVSSVGVYGFPARLPVTEGHPYAPRTAHAATRVEAEMRARRTARDAGVELVIARPATVYGPGDVQGPIAAMAMLVRAGAYRVVGPGDNVLHHTHVDDAVEGLWLAASHPEAAGDHFLFAGPETTTLSSLSELVARAVGRSLPRRHVPSAFARAVATLVDVAANRGVAFSTREHPLIHARLDGLTLPLCFDVTKARRRLGFTPRVHYEEGVMRTLRGEWPALARAGAGP